jgi:hypothetical protein
MISAKSCGMRDIEEGREAIAEGRTDSWEQVKKELGLSAQKKDATAPYLYGNDDTFKPSLRT